MILTKELLRPDHGKYKACDDGYDWFVANFPDGGEYQDVMNALADNEDRDCTDWAQWLLSNVGPDKHAEVVVEGNLSGRKLFFAGSLKITGSISVEFSLVVGEGIEAGDDFGIFAGVMVCLTKWHIYAKVTAKTKPANLISGYWEE